MRSANRNDGAAALVEAIGIAAAPLTRVLRFRFPAARARLVVVSYRPSISSSVRPRMSIDWPVQSSDVCQVDGPMRVMFGGSTPPPITSETLNTLLSQLRRLQKQVDRDIRWPLLLALEECRVAKQTAQGVAPWADRHIAPSGSRRSGKRPRR